MLAVDQSPQNSGCHCGCGCVGVGGNEHDCVFQFQCCCVYISDMKVVCRCVYECAYMHVHVLPLQEVLGTELLLHLESGLAAMV